MRECVQNEHGACLADAPGSPDLNHRRLTRRPGKLFGDVQRATRDSADLILSNVDAKTAGEVKAKMGAVLIDPGRAAASALGASKETVQRRRDNAQPEGPGQRRSAPSLTA